MFDGGAVGEWPGKVAGLSAVAPCVAPVQEFLAAAGQAALAAQCHLAEVR